MIALWIAFVGVGLFAVCFGTVAILKLRVVEAEFFRLYGALTEAVELRRDLEEVSRTIGILKSDIRGLEARADINDKTIGDALVRLVDLEQKVDLVDILSTEKDDDGSEG